METVRQIFDNLKLNWVFFAVLVIFLIGIIIGYTKGAFKMVFAVVSIVLAIFLTIVLSPITRAFLMKNEKLYNATYSKMEGIVESSGWIGKLAVNMAGNGETEPENSGSDSVGLLRSALDMIGVPESFKESIIGDESVIAKMEISSDADVNDRLESVEQGTCTGITNIVIKALAFVLTLIIVGIILAILGGILNLIGKIPGIESVNSIIGGIAGGCISLLVVWILFAIVTMLSATAVGQTILSLINENPILLFIYEHNFITARILS